MRLAILDDYQAVARVYADWDALSPEVEVSVFGDHLSDSDALVERLSRFEAIVAMRERTPFPRSLLERLPNLRLLVTTGPGNRSIDLGAAADAGVVVCATGYAGASTVELAWGLVIALTRNIVAEDAAVRAGRWQVSVGRELAGRTIGILGLGRIGSRIAAIAALFEMEVLAWSENLTAERASAAGARLVAKDELLASADVVTLHLVLSDRTRAIIGERELALMKPSAYLVNTSRGPLVAEDALIAALRERRIAGAALDVFDEEPLPPDHPLRGLPNTVITPHIGYVAHDQYSVFFRDALEDVRAFLAGAPVRVLTPR